jgi:hypothetical protein
MKLMRIGPAGAESPALPADASGVLDVSGTPAGVALGLPGNPYLRAGDTVTVAIGGLGTQNQTFAEA